MPALCATLHEVGGLTWRQVGEQLGMSSAQAWRLGRRGLEELRGAERRGRAEAPGSGMH
jgi:DNA-directed RNA polymerase specialized sigma24 family protein